MKNKVIFCFSFLLLLQQIRCAERVRFLLKNDSETGRAIISPVRWQEECTTHLYRYVISMPSLNHHRWNDNGRRIIKKEGMIEASNLKQAEMDLLAMGAYKGGVKFYFDGPFISDDPIDFYQDPNYKDTCPFRRNTNRIARRQSFIDLIDQLHKNQHIQQINFDSKLTKIEKKQIIQAMSIFVLLCNGHITQEEYANIHEEQKLPSNIQKKTDLELNTVSFLPFFTKYRPGNMVELSCDEANCRYSDLFPFILIKYQEDHITSEDYFITPCLLIFEAMCRFEQEQKIQTTDSMHFYVGAVTSKNQRCFTYSLFNRIKNCDKKSKLYAIMATKKEIVRTFYNYYSSLRPSAYAYYKKNISKDGKDRHEKIRQAYLDAILNMRIEDTTTVPDELCLTKCLTERDDFFSIDLNHTSCGCTECFQKIAHLKEVDTTSYQKILPIEKKILLCYLINPRT